MTIPFTALELMMGVAILALLWRNLVLTSERDLLRRWVHYVARGQATLRADEARIHLIRTQGARHDAVD
jgi:hypothetical protein